MYTQCPECLSVFSLDAQTLAQAHGHVVCGHCNASFGSMATLTEQLPPEPFVELSINEPALEPPVLDLVVYRPQPEPLAVLPDEFAVAGEPPPGDFSRLVFAPRFAHKSRRDRARKAERAKAPRTRAGSGERRWPWVIACCLLLTLLLSQLAWAKRDDLIRNPTVGSWLRGSCAVLHCRVPLVAAPDRLRLLASNVQAHSEASNALMISASIRNDATFAQPYPVVTITLADAQGQRLAMRRLQPREYLDDRAILRRGLAPGATSVLLLEVADPGDKAVAFEFGFE
ncbi:MAG TPA: zinc-ribbon and DUF3426 domain-containing protein [Rhodanobacter sp.]|jgi:predicted Zn finger-like uncharacterized protein|nr:zinc-ribbon and DUF3426 domain-containing protein [Rhodanobacter sp.]